MIATETLHVIGGGLAGCEAAWQAARQGIRVILHEMRPEKKSDAHKTNTLAELVCSNSLKSQDPFSAPGRLKKEMAALDSLIIATAHQSQVPAGSALAVDRLAFSDSITQKLISHPLITVLTGEVSSLPSQEELESKNASLIIATGPLTSESLTPSLQALCGDHSRLYFYDAIAPILAAESIDMDHCFLQNRYGQKDETGDYLNIALSKEEYDDFIREVKEAEKVPLHDFESTSYFEACLPIEVMIERGAETLRFGPLKPVGITNPLTGRQPWANIQLRQENKARTMFSLVGFQTRLKWPEQKRILAKIPALREAEFLRYGSIHRNTYIRSPDVLGPTLEFRSAPRIRLAGQITGVEGYVESAAMGLLAGRAAAAQVRGRSFAMPPETTVLGALASYVTSKNKGTFAPMNANLGLLPPAPKARGQKKSERRSMQCMKAEAAFNHYIDQLQKQPQS